MIDVVCGENFVLTLAQSGKVYAWGRGFTGKFYGTQEYAQGSDIICFVPRAIPNLDMVQRYLVIKEHSVPKFNNLLMDKLLRLKESK